MVINCLPHFVRIRVAPTLPLNAQPHNARPALMCLLLVNLLLACVPVMNNYQAAAAAAAQGYGPPASPHTVTPRPGYPPANSPGPGPALDIYSSSGADSVAGYVQAPSPQPPGFPAIAVSRAPINYNPVSC